MSAIWSSGARAPQKPVLTMASAGNACRTASTAEAARGAPAPLAASTSWWLPRRAERDQATGTVVDFTSVRCRKMPGNSLRSAATMRIFIGDVGQAGSLRGGWLPPPFVRDREVWPIDNRPQLDKLPHNALARPCSSGGGVLDRPEACPTEPCDGAGERLVGRRRAEAEFALRLGVRHPHLLLRHADGIQRHARRVARDAGPRGAARSGTVRHQVRKAEGGRLPYLVAY